MLILQFNQLNHKRKFHFHILLPSPKTLSLIRWWTFASFLDVYGHHAEVQLSGFDFHGVLIDEVAQATETSCILAPPHTDTMEIRTNWPCLFGQSSCLFISKWQVGQVGPYRRGCCTGSRCLPCCHALQSLVTWYGHCCTSMDPTSCFRSFQHPSPPVRCFRPSESGVEESLAELKHGTRIYIYIHVPKFGIVQEIDPQNKP